MKILCRLLLVLTLALPAVAQTGYTVVTGTITDSNSNAYAYCSWTAAFSGTATTFNSVAFDPQLTKQRSGTCDGTGTLSITLPANTSFDGTTKWNFFVTSQDKVTSFGPTAITITGTTQSITTTLSNASVAQPCMVVDNPNYPSGKVLNGNCGSNGGGGNVNNSGTPLIHQTAVWTDATHVKGIANGTTGQVWTAATGADPGWAAAPAGGSKTVVLLNAVNQGTGATGGTSGVSASCSWPNSLYTAYAQKGDGTHPQLGMAEFPTPGSLTAATRVDCSFTMPSNYTANGTITVSGLAGCTSGTSSVTFAANWADFTTGPSLAPTLSSDSTATITPATVASLTAFSITITTPTINPGDLVSISFRPSVDGSGCAPVIPQLIASY